MDLSSLVGRAARTIGRHRSLVVAVLVAIAVVSGLSALRPATQPGIGIWVAARDLGGGAPLAHGDLRLERLPASDAPDGALRAGHDPFGALLAAPLRRGEPLTDVRLLSSPLVHAAGAGDLVAVPVRVADGAAVAALLQPGDAVDVIATTDAQDPPAGMTAPGGTPGGTPDAAATPSSATSPTPTSSPIATPPGMVVSRVRVLAVPTATTAQLDGSADTAGLVVLAVTRPQAATLAEAATQGPLSVAVDDPEEPP